MEFYAVIPASGSGKRFGMKTPKQFYKYRNKEILFRTLDKFLNNGKIKSVYLSVHPGYLNSPGILKYIKKYGKRLTVTAGGDTRQESVFNSLMNIECARDDRIIVHDAVRPFVSDKLLDTVMRESLKYDSVVPGLQVHDTMKRTDEKGIVMETVPRENLWSIQTPQVFHYGRLMRAFKLAFKKRIIGTDEAALMEYAGYKVRIIEGEKTNIKITTKKDLN